MGGVGRILALEGRAAVQQEEEQVEGDEEQEQNVPPAAAAAAAATALSVGTVPPLPGSRDTAMETEEGGGWGSWPMGCVCGSD